MALNRREFLEGLAGAGVALLFGRSASAETPPPTRSIMDVPHYLNYERTRLKKSGKELDLADLVEDADLVARSNPLVYGGPTGVQVVRYLLEDTFVYALIRRDGFTNEEKALKGVEEDRGMLHLVLDLDPHDLSVGPLRGTPFEILYHFPSEKEGERDDGHFTELGEKLLKVPRATEEHSKRARDTGIDRDVLDDDPALRNPKTTYPTLDALLAEVEKMTPRPYRSYNDASLNRMVEYWISRYSTGGDLQPTMKEMLLRGRPFVQIIEEEFRAVGFEQADLSFFVAVMFAESGSKTGAFSPAGAAGLWQFMASTAKSIKVDRGTGPERNVVINSCTDERCEILTATKAAARYLRSLIVDQKLGAIYGLMGYNHGPGNVRKHLRKQPYTAWYGTIAERSQKFLRNKKYKNEPAQYAPRILAIQEILLHPEKYGHTKYADIIRNATKHDFRKNWKPVTVPERSTWEGIERAYAAAKENPEFEDYDLGKALKHMNKHVRNFDRQQTVWVPNIEPNKL